MLSSLLGLTVATLSGVYALQCNGCRGCSKRDTLVAGRGIAEDTGVKLTWLYDFAGKSLEKKDSKVIMGLKHGGEYLTKPEGVVGVYVTSDKEDAAIAGWTELNENQPWNFYAQHYQGKETVYYIPDHVQLVWAGLI